ncbi:S41 family peptidase [Pseudoalteromonas sp. SR44-5]|uniref:S41 family peptidase n=1 Tax=Pseudoalteromonas TaxID=53246 RepID=UPI00160453C1|nr:MULTISPECIES: S41 family peptidase [unclassified Pseudoalteromonas]MBB1331763.1 S41 family peptidase [Pseudoalteromonas sp. SR41-6]MBB1365153.1 S41 family peptidase [Pseudoalteromonas sp. SR44-5]MBB1458781.1 S41 family peptidase [Pseudoalteromonas sp. SG41-8]MBB1478509.1 S41 family peptidase [Pseudoalteromonas sp. SG41-2]
MLNTQLQIQRLQYPVFNRILISYLLLVSVFLCLSFNCFAVTSVGDLKSQQKNEILFNIHAYYVEDLALQQSFESSQQFEALLAQLDPYSKYLDEHELEALFSSTNGRYTGLGIEVKQQQQKIIIVNTIKDSPAAIAGVQMNDVLLAVNQQTVAHKDINQVAQMIKASDTATVTLTIERGNSPQAIYFTLTRSEINLESVTSSLSEFGIGYLAINSFTNHTLHDVARQITALQSHYGNPLTGLVLDLRDNPGGTLQSAVAVSDLFLQSGTIVTTKGRFYDANQHFRAKKGDILNGAPIVVLINENSASAAEILAAALKDNHRATLIGSQSFGKGSVQSLIPLGNGNTALKLTTAKYFTPSGQSIDGIGVTPDVAINQSTLSQIDKVVIIKNEQGNDDQLWSRTDSADPLLLKAQQLLTMK